MYVAKHKSDVNVAVTGAKSCVYNEKIIASALSKNFSSSSLDSVKISSSGMNLIFMLLQIIEQIWLKYLQKKLLMLLNKYLSINLTSNEKFI